MGGFYILDWIIFILVAAGAVWGYQRGLVIQLISITGLIIALWAAYSYYDQAGALLRRVFHFQGSGSQEKYRFFTETLSLETYISNAIGFALIFFIVKFGLSFIGRMLNIIVKVPGLNFINRWSGALLGALESLLLVIVALNVMALIGSPQTEKLLSESRTAPYLLKQLPVVSEKLQQLWQTGTNPRQEQKKPPESGNRI